MLVVKIPEQEWEKALKTWRDVSDSVARAENALLKYLLTVQIPAWTLKLVAA